MAPNTYNPFYVTYYILKRKLGLVYKARSREESKERNMKRERREEVNRMFRMLT